VDGFHALDGFMGARAKSDTGGAMIGSWLASMWRLARAEVEGESSIRCELVGGGGHVSKEGDGPKVALRRVQ
jgi:hypothetical protein